MPVRPAQREAGGPSHADSYGGVLRWMRELFHHFGSTCAHGRTSQTDLALEVLELLEIGVVIAAHLGERISAEFLAHRVRQRHSQHRFADHSACSNSRDI